MSKGKRKTHQDDNDFSESPGEVLKGFLLRNKITIPLLVVLLLPLSGTLPVGLHNFTFDHPSLLLGPLLLMMPIFLAYRITWNRWKSPENLVFLIAFLLVGLIISNAFTFFGLMTARFICPDGYPFTGFSEFILGPSGRRSLMWFEDVVIRVICQGDLGVHQFPSEIFTWLTYQFYLAGGFLAVGVSYLLGRSGRLTGGRTPSGEMHFIRFFLVALVLGVGFLSLPDFFSGANILAERYESSGRKYPMKDPQIARFSPIHGAVLSGDAARVKALLEEGVNKNAIVNGGLTPLAIAVKKKAARIVLVLVEAGADVNLGEKIKQSPMQLAFEGKNPELIAYLQKHGGNPLAVAKGGFGLLASAVKKLDLKTARELLGKGANPNILTELGDRTLLFKTIFEVNNDYYKRPRKYQVQALEMAKLLLKHGANLEFQARYLHTPLVHAIKMDNIWMVKLFLAHGAKVDVLDKYGQNPLYHALKGRFFRKDILALLVEKGVKINHQDYGGRTALISLTQYERAPWPLQWLVSHGADVNMVDKSGQTALDKLERNYWDDKKKKLLLEAGAKSALTR